MKPGWRLSPAVPRPLRFALVGGVGFLVDSSILIILFDGFETDLAPARAVAFFCAATSNWILNRVFTFGDTGLSGQRSLEWIRFVSSALLSAIPNLGAFFCLVKILPETLDWILFSMCCGILAGYFCNYQLARLWVFRSHA